MRDKNLAAERDRVGKVLLFKEKAGVAQASELQFNCDKPVLLLIFSFFASRGPDRAGSFKFPFPDSFEINGLNIFDQLGFLSMCTGEAFPWDHVLEQLGLDGRET